MVLLVFLVVLAVKSVGKLQEENPDWWQDLASSGTSALMMIPGLFYLSDMMVYDEEQQQALLASTDRIDSESLDSES